MADEGADGAYEGAYEGAEYGEYAEGYYGEDGEQRPYSAEEIAAYEAEQAQYAAPQEYTAEDIAAYEAEQAALTEGAAEEQPQEYTAEEIAAYEAEQAALTEGAAEEQPQEYTAEEIAAYEADEEQRPYSAEEIAAYEAEQAQYAAPQEYTAEETAAYEAEQADGEPQEYSAEEIAAYEAEQAEGAAEEQPQEYTAEEIAAYEAEQAALKESAAYEEQRPFTAAEIAEFHAEQARYQEDNEPAAAEAAEPPAEPDPEPEPEPEPAETEPEPEPQPDDEQLAQATLEQALAEEESVYDQAPPEGELTAEEHAEAWAQYQTELAEYEQQQAQWEQAQADYEAEHGKEDAVMAAAAEAADPPLATPAETTPAPEIETDDPILAAAAEAANPQPEEHPDEQPEAPELNISLDDVTEDDEPEDGDPEQDEPPQEAPEDQTELQRRMQQLEQAWEHEDVIPAQAEKFAVLQVQRRWSEQVQDLRDEYEADAAAMTERHRRAKAALERRIRRRRRKHIAELPWSVRLRNYRASQATFRRLKRDEQLAAMTAKVKEVEAWEVRRFLTNIGFRDRWQGRRRALRAVQAAEREQLDAVFGARLQEVEYKRSVHVRLERRQAEYASDTIWTQWFAARTGNLERLRLLLHPPAEPPLELARLQRSPADINARDPDSSWTALHFACRQGHEAVINYLLDEGASPNVKDRHGNTCVHVAAAWGPREVVALLSRRGGDLEAGNNAGMTPARLAEEFGRTVIRDLILAARVGMTYEERVERARLPDPPNFDNQPEAVAAARRSLWTKERALGRRHVGLTPWLQRLVAALSAEGMAREAVDAQTQLLLLTEAHCGAEHLETAAVLNNLGSLQIAAGKPGAAAETIQRALAAAAALKGPHDPLLAQLSENAAVAQFMARRYGAAANLLTRALRIRERQHGDVSENLLSLLALRAQTHMRLGAAPHAKEALRRSIAIVEHVAHGEPDARLIALEEQLGLLAFEAGAVAEAEAHFAAALRVLRATTQAEADETRILENMSVCTIQGARVDASLDYEPPVALEALPAPKVVFDSTSVSSVSDVAPSPLRDWDAATIPRIGILEDEERLPLVGRP